MSSAAILHVWEPARRVILERHQFYFDQAKVRLLSPFVRIADEVTELMNRWPCDNAHRFDPETVDEGDIVEMARDAAILQYELLTMMENQT